MTPDNEAIVRGLRESLEHNLPSDMKQGIQASIAHLTGRPDPTPAPDPTPRDALYNLPITFTPKVSVNGKPLHAPKTTEIF
jgi:hypothetical protein